MAVDVVNAIESEVAKGSLIPIELYAMDVKDGVVLYFTNYGEDVSFDGVVYTALGIKRSAIRTDSRNRGDSVSMEFDNVDSLFSAFLDNADFKYELEGRTFVITRVFGGLTGDADNKVERFDGYMDELEVDKRWFRFRVKSNLSDMNQEVPRRTFGPECRWVFGDADCTLDTGVQAGSVSEVFSAVHFNCVMPGIPNSDFERGRTTRSNFWVDGYITVTDFKGVSEKRRVKRSTDFRGTPNYTLFTIYDEFKNVVLIPALDVVVIAGSDKTFASCLNKNNTDNFGGFLGVVDRWKVKTT